MKKKLLYICADYCVVNRFMSRHAIGIQKKVDMQRRCFEKAGYEVQYGIMYQLPQNIYPKLTDFNLFSSSIDWQRINTDTPIDVVYVRFHAVEFGLLRFLHKIKKKNNKVKILFEFQTFPIGRNYSFKNQDSAYYKFRVFTEFLRLYVDRVILCTPDYKEIYGIRTLYMPNGVEYRNTEIIPKNHSKDEIHLIAVSSMMPAHGLDRIIKGMGNYYKQHEDRKVILHLAGRGGEEDNYRILTADYGLMDYVIFEGYCTGEKLENLYLLADIGIYDFGAHRISKELVSGALKLKEEASYGLPIIGSGRTDMDGDACMEYMFKFPADETDIDVGKIVSFYDKVYDGDKATVRNTIKEVFRPYYDVQETLKTVLEYMEG